MHLTCTETIRESDDSLSAWFACSTPVVAKGGQYITLSVSIQGRVQTRSYSLSGFVLLAASSALRITVKRVDKGLVSNWLVDNCREGMQFETSKPMGSFTLDDDAISHTFIAAGSGISPIAAMLREACKDRPGSRCNLLYIFRDRASAPLLTELESLSSCYPKLNITTWETHSLGRPDSTQILDVISEWQADSHYVCGPESLIDTVSQLDLECLRMERFNIPVASLENVTMGNAKVTFSKSNISIEVNEAETILDLAEANGIDINSSCRAGDCHECKLRHNNPDAIAWLDRDDALTEEEKQEFLLACCTSIVGEVSIDC